MSILILIPARAGSKGLPGKNTKLLGGKPLITYTLEFAAQIKEPNDEICVSTNDDEVIRLAEAKGIKVPFKRPEELSTDAAGSYEVILHALNFYKEKGMEFKQVLLLQPTSPFRIPSDYRSLTSIFKEGCDMAVTVKLSKDSPYFNLFEENSQGFMEKSKSGTFERRQDCPSVYVYNGSMYLINVSSLQKSNLHELKRIRKSMMPDERSIDIDSYADWALAEYFLNKFLNESN
jgi:N-acylneuraminate cytidylyltransferase